MANGQSNNTDNPTETDQQLGKCFNCGGLDHVSARCNHCTKCRVEGHNTKKCPRNARCRECGKLGQIKAECPSVKCAECGGPGHMVATCPELYVEDEITREPKKASRRFLPFTSRVYHNGPTGTRCSQEMLHLDIE